MKNKKKKGKLLKLNEKLSGAKIVRDSSRWSNSEEDSVLCCGRAKVLRVIKISCALLSLSLSLSSC
jgi:hypothetical protein